MSIVSIERRLSRIEARRFASDPAIKALSDDELAEALRAASADPADHALADWFQAGGDADLPPIALDAVMRSL